MKWTAAAFIDRLEEHERKHGKSASVRALADKLIKIKEELARDTLDHAIDQMQKGNPYPLWELLNAPANS